jgi:AraC-like DNA-binding protein
VEESRLLGRDGETSDGANPVAEPTLAAVVGGHVVAVPSGRLRQQFRYTWTQRLPDRNVGPIAVVPDGGIDLRWIEGRLSVDGPHRSVMGDALPPGTFVVGFRFRPDAAHRWLGLPASEIADRCVALEELWGAEARRLAEWASEARTPTGIARRLEQALGDRVATVGPVDAEVGHLFALIERGTGAAVAAAHLGMGERTLRRRCHEAFGYGPKTLERVLRFQRFLRLVHGGHREAGLARRAAAAGYADQAHLAREARRLSGLSPRTIVAQLAR